MLVNQPTTKTNRKVKYSSWTAAWVSPLAVVLAALAVPFLPTELANVQLELSLLFTFTITGLGTWVVGYYTREYSPVQTT